MQRCSNCLYIISPVRQSHTQTSHSYSYLLSWTERQHGNQKSKEEMKLCPNRQGKHIIKKGCQTHSLAFFTLGKEQLVTGVPPMMFIHMNTILLVHNRIKLQKLARPYTWDTTSVHISRNAARNEARNFSDKLFNLTRSFHNSCQGRGCLRQKSEALAIQVVKY